MSAPEFTPDIVGRVANAAMASLHGYAGMTVGADVALHVAKAALEASHHADLTATIGELLRGIDGAIEALVPGHWYPGNCEEWAENQGTTRDWLIELRAKIGGGGVIFRGSKVNAEPLHDITVYCTDCEMPDDECVCRAEKLA